MDLARLLLYVSKFDFVQKNLLWARALESANVISPSWAGNRLPPCCNHLPHPVFLRTCRCPSRELLTGSILAYTEEPPCEEPPWWLLDSLRSWRVMSGLIMSGLSLRKTPLIQRHRRRQSRQWKRFPPGPRHRSSLRQQQNRRPWLIGTPGFPSATPSASNRRQPRRRRLSPKRNHRRIGRSSS